MQLEDSKTPAPNPIKFTTTGKVAKKRGRKPKPKVEKPIKIRKKPGPKPNRKERASLLLGSGSNKLESSNFQALLATKLINGIKYSPTGRIGLNYTAANFNVPKESIHDIAGVLDGIGLIGKQSEDIIVWKGVESAAVNIEEYVNGPINTGRYKLDGGADGVKAQVKDLKWELTDLYKEDSMLDTWIGALESFSNSSNEASQARQSRGLHCGKDEVMKALSKKQEENEIINTLSKKRDGEISDGSFDDKICTLVVSAPTGSMLEIPCPSNARDDDNDIRISTEHLKSTITTQDKETSSDTKKNRINLYYITSSYDSASKSYQNVEGPMLIEQDFLATVNKHDIDYGTSSICINFEQDTLMDLLPNESITQQQRQSITEFY